MKSPISKTGYKLIQKWYFVAGGHIRELLTIKNFTGVKDKRAI